MRLFNTSTPKTSPELVRHSTVSDGPVATPHPAAAAVGGEAPSASSGGGGGTPPRQHSPSLVRQGVSTLGRKFSKRFEKFGESETARKLRMASPSRKYHFGGGESESSPNLLDHQTAAAAAASKKRVSRVDSFRNFFMMATPAAAAAAAAAGANGSLKTPRAVKRRSNRSGRSEAGTNCDLRLKLPPDVFGSDLTLNDCSQSEVGGGGGGRDISECHSEVDLRFTRPSNRSVVWKYS